MSTRRMRYRWALPDHPWMAALLCVCLFLATLAWTSSPLVRGARRSRFEEPGVAWTAAGPDGFGWDGPASPGGFGWDGPRG
jgi:hypothetical protein